LSDVESDTSEKTLDEVSHGGLAAPIRATVWIDTWNTDELLKKADDVIRHSWVIATNLIKYPKKMTIVYAAFRLNCLCA